MNTESILNYDKNGTESETVEFIRKSISMLKHSDDDPDYNVIYQIFQNLSQSYFDFSNYRNALGIELSEQNYVPLASDYLLKFSKLGYFTSDDIWFSTYYLLSSLWNYTDISQNIVNEILKTELPRLLVSNILHKPYLEELQNYNISFLLQSSISIIHNIVRHPGNYPMFQINELKKSFVDLIRRDDTDMIGIMSLLTLACLITENELELLDGTENTITILIDIIRSAQNSPDKRVNGFAVWELLNGLDRISVNDNMKKSIVKENGIKVIMEIIESPSCDSDIEKCLGVLWNLCFDKEIQASILKDYDIRNIIKPFQNHNSLQIKKNSEGVLWLIDNKAQAKRRIKSAHLNKAKSKMNKWKFDVFFSYSWANRDIVLSVRDELEKCNISVWIDVDQMKGSALESMADGIETSKVFIMAVSDSYRTSANCRTEAEYAFSLRKPIIPVIVELKYKPVGWLGIMMGSKTYYEFSERRDFTQSFNRLFSNIEAIKNSVEELVVASRASKDMVDSFVHPGTNEQNLAFLKWTKKDVEIWLIKNGLDYLKERFSEIDGKLLGCMKRINSKSPDYLYETLKSEYGMKLVDILKLNLAFEDLKF